MRPCYNISLSAPFVKNKIYAMALVHDKLYSKYDLNNINIKHYIEELFIYYKNNEQEFFYKHEVALNISDVMMNINQAIPFGLLINEIVSNSIKHAFPDNREGFIYLYLKKDDDVFKVDLGDDGVGLTKDFSSGFGTELINALIYQLDAKIEVINENGLKYKIEFKQR